MKKPPISFISVCSLFISIGAFAFFAVMLERAGAIGWWMYAIWIVSSITSLVYPIAAKYIRSTEGSRGKVFEIIALIIGFFIFNMTIGALLPINGTVLLLLGAVPCILYAKLFNPKAD